MNREIHKLLAPAPLTSQPRHVAIETWTDFLRLAAADGCDKGLKPLNFDDFLTLALAIAGRAHSAVSGWMVVDLEAWQGSPVRAVMELGKVKQATTTPPTLSTTDAGNGAVDPELLACVFDPFGLEGGRWVQAAGRLPIVFHGGADAPSIGFHPQLQGGLARSGLLKSSLIHERQTLRLSPAMFQNRKARA